MTIQNKVKISIVFFIISILFVLILVLNPLLKEIKNNSTDLISQEEKSVSLDEKIKNLEGLKAVYSQFEPNLEKIDALLVNSEMPIDFISFLEGIGKLNQGKIKISSVSCSKTEEDIWPSVCFQVSFAGATVNFFKFLEKIENSPYLVSIKNLNINMVKEKNNVSIQANILLKIYSK